MRALLDTAYSPLSRPEIERTLLAMVDHLLLALWEPDFTADKAVPVGDELVDARFSNADSLRVTVETLGGALLDWANAAALPNAGGRVLALLGALSAGHSEAVRNWLFEEQEQVKRALFVATTRAEKRFQRSEARFREVFTRAAVGFAISTPDGRIIMANPALARIVDSEPDALVGRDIEEFFHPQDMAALRAGYAQPAAEDDDRVPLRLRHRLIRADGQPAWVYLAASMLADTDEGAGLQLTMVEDVSDLHLLQDTISYQTLHDVLTRLPNRQYLLSRLQTVLGDDAPRRMVALFHLDLDGFSVVNDGLGPEAGDQLLRTVAARLRELFTNSDALIVRTGGDEFAVLLWSDTGSVDVLGTVNRINERLAEPVYLQDAGRDVGVALSASIGVARGRADELDPHELLRAADTTLRRMRAAGHRQWAEFDPILDRAERQRLRLAAGLPGALEFGELEVVWLPWVRLHTEDLVGVTARVRWVHPNEGVLDHDQCLELAAETGAVLSIGAWLLRAACQQAADWRAAYGPRIPPVGVNLSRTQAVDPDLVAVVGSALTEADLPADAITLSVPSTALGGSDSDAQESVGVLSEMGLNLVLSDIGTNLGDVGVLDEFPARAVELSGDMVSKVMSSQVDSVLIRTAAAGMQSVRTRGLPVLVRGLDTVEQLTWWRNTLATAGSGAALAPPMSAEEFEHRYLRPDPSLDAGTDSGSDPE